MSEPCEVCGGTEIEETYGGHGTVLELPCSACCPIPHEPAMYTQREYDELRREIDDAYEALGPGTRFMDPPDGGSPSLADQIRNAVAMLDAAEARASRTSPAGDGPEGAFEFDGSDLKAIIDDHSDFDGTSWTAAADDVREWFARAFRTTPAGEAGDALAVSILHCSNGFKDDRLYTHTAPAGAWRRLLSAPLPVRAGWRPTHRHVKRGSEYELLGEAEIQISGVGVVGWPVGSAILREDDRICVYRDKEGRLWARLPNEFHDGRFVALPEPPAAPRPPSDAGGR